MARHCSSICQRWLLKSFEREKERGGGHARSAEHWPNPRQMMMMMMAFRPFRRPSYPIDLWNCSLSNDDDDFMSQCVSVYTELLILFYPFFSDKAFGG